MDFVTNIRNTILNRDIYRVLNDLVCAESDEGFYGRYYGVVEDNADPLKKGRIKVRIYSLFPDSIQAKDIPWAIPDWGYAGSLKGSFIVPPKNTKVRVTFDGGDIYCPVYEAKGYSQGDLPDGIATDYPDTMIMYSTDSGESYEVNRKKNTTKLKIAGKIAIGKGNAELLDLITQTLDALLTSVVPTSLGPQQLSKVTDGTILKIKTTLATITGKL